MATSHAGPGTAEVLTRLLREFMAGLREHLVAHEDEDPDVVAERIYAAIAAAGAAILLALPLGRRADGIVTALLAAAARYWARRAARG